MKNYKERKKIVYLVGPIELSKDYGIGWRKMITPFLKKQNYEVIDPIVEDLKDELNPNWAEKEYPLPEKRLISRSIVDRDIRFVQQCDIVLCNYEDSGRGTIGEITYGHIIDRPILIVTEIQPKKLPVWVLGCATKIFPNFDKLKEYLKEQQLEE